MQHRRFLFSFSTTCLKFQNPAFPILVFQPPPWREIPPSLQWQTTPPVNLWRKQRPERLRNRPRTSRGHNVPKHLRARHRQPSHYLKRDHPSTRLETLTQRYQILVQVCQTQKTVQEEAVQREEQSQRKEMGGETGKICWGSVSYILLLFLGGLVLRCFRSKNKYLKKEISICLGFC